MTNLRIINGYTIKSGANLNSADLLGANLRGADLSGANLYGANLCGADLRGANLRDANLLGANLLGANLRRANLSGADLSSASLCRANLRGAHLRGANLSGASLRGAKLPYSQIPQEGELVVYKKTTGGIVKLRIPPDAKRTASLVGRKCRAEFAEVLSAAPGSRSLYGDKLAYVTGRTIKPDMYDDDIRVECTHGIHFFLTREEAEEY